MFKEKLAYENMNINTNKSNVSLPIHFVFADHDLLLHDLKFISKFNIQAMILLFPSVMRVGVFLHTVW